MNFRKKLWKTFEPPTLPILVLGFFVANFSQMCINLRMCKNYLIWWRWASLSLLLSSMLNSAYWYWVLPLVRWCFIMTMTMDHHIKPPPYHQYLFGILVLGLAFDQMMFHDDHWPWTTISNHIPILNTKFGILVSGLAFDQMMFQWWPWTTISNHIPIINIKFGILVLGLAFDQIMFHDDHGLPYRTTSLSSILNLAYWYWVLHLIRWYFMMTMDYHIEPHPYHQY